jgi:GDP-L-fucose synthase
VLGFSKADATLKNCKTTTVGVSPTQAVGVNVQIPFTGVQVSAANLILDDLLAIDLDSGGMALTYDSRIYVAGHRGLVGSAIWRELQRQGFAHLIGRSHAELDLLDASEVDGLYGREKPEFVFVAAAKVGGIKANQTFSAEFLYQNLQIQINLIHGAHRAGVKKLLFLGSSCIYPRLAPQPLKEESLLTGPLEPTNQWYAVAKIAGIKMCQAYRRQYGRDFISVMPTNMYGPNDNYDPENSHVLPALIRRFHEAKLAGSSSVTCWGTGAPLREFLYADDLAKACVFLMQNYSEESFINVGYGSDVSVKELAETVRRVVGYDGGIVWDPTKPDGTPRKLMDSSRLFKMGWKPQVDLETGIRLTYEDFLKKFSSVTASP